MVLTIAGLASPSAFGQWVANFSFVAVTNNGLPFLGGTYSGPGVVGTGTYWNILTNTYNVGGGTRTNTTAFADDGTTSLGITLNVAQPFIYAYGSVSLLLDSYAQITSGTATFSFTNIPNGSYNLVLFGVNGEFGHANRGTTFTVNGQSRTTTNSILASNTSYVEGGNYVTFLALTVTNQSLSGTYQPGPFSGTKGYFNGVQLQYNGLAPVAPTVSAASPSSLLVAQSVPAQFGATASGYPAPGVYWQFSTNGNPPWINVTNSTTVSGAKSNVLTLSSAQPGQAGYYQLVATNSAGAATSSPPAQLTVTVLPTTWTANFDFDTYAGGFVGTYAGSGVIGSGTYWNSVPGSAGGAGGTFPSSSGILDDGTTDAGISMTINANACWSFNPVNNALLDDYAMPATSGSSFSFQNVPGGVYSVVLFGAPAAATNTGTSFTINGVTLSTTNTGNDTTFVAGDNYVVISNVAPTSGALSGTYVKAPGAAWSGFNGAQLRYIGSNAAPSIFASPADQATLQRYTVKFSVGAGGYPLNYQWQSGTATNGPFANLSNTGNVSGANASVLTITNVALNQAGYYRVIVTNSLGSVTSSVANLHLTPATNEWTVNFDFDNNGGGTVGTYGGAGVIGSVGTYWNSISVTNGTSATNVTAFSDDGVTNRGVALRVDYQGYYSAPGSPVNMLLDDYASIKTNTTPSRPFVFTNLPNGVYNLVLYAQQGAYNIASTTFYLTNTGTAQSCINGASGDKSFVSGENYAQFPMVYVTNGIISGTWSYNAPNQAAFSGAQLQYLGTGGMTSTTPVTPVIGSVKSDLNGFSFTVAGASGQSYTVLSSTNIAAPLAAWTTNVQGVFGPGGVIGYTNSPPLSPERFFKVRSP